MNIALTQCYWTPAIICPSPDPRRISTQRRISASCVTCLGYLPDVVLMPVAGHSSDFCPTPSFLPLKDFCPSRILLQESIHHHHIRFRLLRTRRDRKYQQHHQSRRNPRLHLAISRASTASASPPPASTSKLMA
ncbi:hypothetical protein IEQ34_018508 [Dendrobium chrysotoxum]|uniref:Uncharacterized protein n=1 Tax=Dendrobium chrysotoxum TaxID=161865 RepID=A0AAV7G5E4_DENCH|nr:hypothetical protein IEQ34_018508 [Dendrobium chrysotoxum]